MNAKQVNKLQNTVIKESRRTLIGAVKQYCALFNSAIELKTLVATLNKEGANITPDIVKAITTLAKNKNEVVKVCCEMLPKVDNTFIKFAVLQKEYTGEDGRKVVEKKDRNKLDIVIGSSYKSFGFASPVDIPNDDDDKCYLVSQTEKSKTIRIAVKLSSYNVTLVAKCVSEYLSHESKEA